MQTTDCTWPFLLETQNECSWHSVYRDAPCHSAWILYIGFWTSTMCFISHLRIRKLSMDNKGALFKSRWSVLYITWDVINKMQCSPSTYAETKCNANVIHSAYNNKCCTLPVQCHMPWLPWLLVCKHYPLCFTNVTHLRWPCINPFPCTCACILRGLIYMEKSHQMCSTGDRDSAVHSRGGLRHTMGNCVMIWEWGRHMWSLCICMCHGSLDWERLSVHFQSLNAVTDKSHAPNAELKAKPLLLTIKCSHRY